MLLAATLRQATVPRMDLEDVFTYLLGPLLWLARATGRFAFDYIWWWGGAFEHPLANQTWQSRCWRGLRVGFVCALLAGAALLAWRAVAQH